MADTIREKIIKNFLTRAALVAPATGYVNNLSNALRAQSPVPETELPCLNILPGREETVNRFGKNEVTTTITVEAYKAAAADVNKNVDQEAMLGDLIRAFTRPDSVVSAYVDHIKYIEGGPASVPDSADKVVGVSAVFEVQYTTDIGDPYNQ